jgi:gas vesicle protein
MSSQNSETLLFTGLVIGGLVGTGSALLLVPQSGEETRGQIKDKSLELKDGAMEGLAEAGHHVQAQAAVWQDKGKRNATEATSRSEHSIIQAVNQSKDRVVGAIG